jgi:hypothetical protein
MTEQKYTATERYVMGWTDWRVMYGTPSRRWWQWKIDPQIVTNLVGTIFIMLPVIAIAYHVWKWMGWL